MTREFLFAERKSSATQTKGCPFPEEKGDHAVVDESDETSFLSFIIYIRAIFQSLHCSPQGVTFAQSSAKVTKSALFCWHGSYIFEYTLSPPATPDYEADLFSSLYELTTVTCSLHFILFAPACVCCFRSGQVPLQFTPEPVDAHLQFDIERRRWLRESTFGCFPRMP